MREYFDHPFDIDARGRVAVTPPDDHVRDLIWQVLFTAPGERVNRPDFGCGLQTLVFAPNSSALAAATQFTVQGALQRWLADRIVVERVRIHSDNEVLTVEVSYIRRDTGQRQSDVFSHGGTA
ncbi:MAG TPA: GPW/gp25 family protein [Thermoanaerobaculia bacterium]|jgi:hypothetical protein